MKTPETPEDEKYCRVLSIDALRDECGWQWNNWYDVGSAPVSVCDMTTRRLLAYLRAEGYLTSRSAGRVAVEDDGFNIEIRERGNGRPLYALEYGAGL